MDLESIIRSRDNILKKAIAWFKLNTATKGIFLAGSLATDESDAYSDIDLIVVVTDSELNRYVENRLEAPQRWGDLLLNEWWPRAHHCVSHFKPFIKMDVFYYGVAEIKPSPWYALPIRVAYDPEGIVEKIIDQSVSLSFEIDEGEMDRLISRGIACAHESYRRLKRSELFYAKNLMDSLRSCIILLDDAIHGRNTISSPFSKYERRGEERDQQKLTASYGKLDQKLMFDNLGLLIDLFCVKMEAAHKQFSMNRNIDNDRYALAIIQNDKN